MSNEQPSRPRPSGKGASPMGSTLAIVIAIAAVVVGFLIIKNIGKDDSPGTAATTLPTTTTIDQAVPVSTAAPLPTQPPVTVFQPTTTGAKVLVANASHQNGVAKTLSTALQGSKFTMVDPATGSTKETATKIQYKEGDQAAQAVAESVAQLMGVATVEPLPTPVALKDPTLLADATVVVLLGDDKAGKTLAQMTAVTTPTTLAGATPTT